MSVNYFDILRPVQSFVNECYCLESNEVLRLKFQKLHSMLVNNINPGNIIGFLFQEAVIGALDVRTLLNITDPWQQCARLLALLHMSDNPQAFVKLYAAIKEEPELQWLIDRIDKFTDQSVTDLLQQLDITKTTGEQAALRRTAGRKFKKNIFNHRSPSKPFVTH